MSTTMLQQTEDRDQRVVSSQRQNLLLGPPSPNRASQADFLDDKLQTLLDLESLDALLVSVRNQHVLLRKQVICHHSHPCCHHY